MPKRLTNDLRIEKYGHPRQPRSEGYRPPVKRFILNQRLEQVPFWIHPLVADRVVDAYQSVSVELEEWPFEIQGYNVRKIAGSESFSLHSWALASDIFSLNRQIRDPMTGRGTMSKRWFQKVASRSGMVWGGTFSKPDVHHIEWPY